MIEWPKLLARAPDYAWRLRSVVRPSPAGIDGTFQPRRRIDGGGRWECTLSGVYLHKKSLIKLARAMEVIANGGLTQMVVRTCECGFSPMPEGAEVALVPHDDQTSFDDGTYYVSNGVSISIAVNASKRSKTITINLDSAKPFEGGEAFSIVHPVMGERRYHVGEVGVAAGGVQQISFSPPLREDVTTSDVVNAYAPGNVMYLANYDEFLADINMNRFSTASAVFVESFDVPTS